MSQYHVLVGLGFKDLMVFNKALMCKLELELACDHINGKFLDFSILKLGFGVGANGGCGSVFASLR